MQPSHISAIASTAHAVAIVMAVSAVATAAPLSQPGAHTAPAPPILVLEAQVGPPFSSTAVVEPVLRELARRGHAADPASILALLGERVPRPGVLDADRTADDIRSLCERGFETFTRGEYADAVATLSVAIDLIKRNPGLVVFDTDSSRAAFRAFVGLALSQSRLGRTDESIETMTELIRSFSTRTVTRAEFGPQAEQAYRAAQKRVQAAGRAQLAIATDDPRALLFINGELRGTGKAVAELVPGAYRVFIQSPGVHGRQYRISVQAGGSSVLDVNCQADAMLHVSDAWVGLVYANEAERARQAVHAGAMARRWHQRAILVIEATRFDGQEAVQGTVYDPEGDVVRSALVVPAGDPARSRALVAFLTEGVASASVVVARSEETGRHARELRAAGREQPTMLPVWSFVAGGVLALGTGIGLLAIDQDRGRTDAQGMRPAYYRDTAPFGIAAGVAGVASIGVGVLWWRRVRHRPLPNVSIQPSHVAFSLSVDY